MRCVGVGVGVAASIMERITVRISVGIRGNFGCRSRVKIGSTIHGCNSGDWLARVWLSGGGSRSSAVVVAVRKVR